MDFIDAKGAEQIWYQGFYIAPATGNAIVRAACQVPAGAWYPQEPGRGDIRLANLPDHGSATSNAPCASGQSDMRLSTLPDPPVYIKWVEFSASGHDFDTDVREVRLLAQ